MDRSENGNGSNLGNDFKEDALFIVDSLEICIDKFGFSEELREEINAFSEQNHSKQEEEIEKKIASIYMEFLGKTNFKNKNAATNKELFSQLKKEIDEVRNLVAE
ncbi:hypothetical protein KDC22_07340 [Paenibacillus tritici]|uniref:hypothetical protein n=1 Tax=Paenibacillus tritici TaxID=1873425 RepID=UPI001BAD10C6|nr:hypothetical protein [Paenibacillus tritici]QUL56311.1 hypothetical protein KDC22_07340 [Paenibacillus tritici]